MKKGDKNIRLLGASSFFNDIGSEMITPVLPFYVTALGGTGFAVGLIFIMSYIIAGSGNFAQICAIIIKRLVLSKC